MFPQFGATAETLSKASTMVFRIGTDAHLYDDPDDVNIAQLLDSKFDSEKCEALKRLLALIAQGFDVSNFFPQVVKNVASQSLEVKKLVYLYLLHYAEKRPNEALLSINCFQKDLRDPNPLVRAWALRTMAGIRLHVIAPIVLVAVGKCARDPSVYVRKCAANALPKLHDLRLEENTASIEEIVEILLSDRSPGVVGAATAAFACVCPNNLSLIARNYRGLCVILPDVEEWGQIILIGILLRYVIARHGLVKDSIMSTLHHTEKSQSEQHGPEPETGLALFEDNGDLSSNCEPELAYMVSKCYLERSNEYLSRSILKNKASFEFKWEWFTSGRSNENVKILLQCTSPLLWSNNSAVVLAAASVHWVMAPRDDVKKIVKPLLFILRSSNESKYVVLCNIQVFAKAMPFLFASHFEDFFICSSDTYQTKALKLEILASIATDSSISLILKEFQDYIRDPDRRFAADTVVAIGICVQRLPVMANMCLKMLLALTKQECFTSDLRSVEGEAAVLVQAIMSTKLIIRQDPPSHEKVIIHWIRSLDSIKVPAARAMIIWLVGEYSSLGEVIPKLLNTVLKHLAWCFTSEELEAKLQTLNTAAKVLLGAKGEDLLTFRRILSYVLELAKCDISYDVRDRAFFIENLILSHLDSQGLEEQTNSLPESKDLSHVLAGIIFGEQTKPMPPEPSYYRFYLPGSLSQIVLHAAPGYDALPKPCSLTRNELETNASGEEPINSDLSMMDNPDSLSGSSDEESASHYISLHSVTVSSGSEGSDESGSASEDNDSTDPLIKLSDVGNAHMQNGASQSDNDDFEKLMSRKALESWLDEQPGSSSVDTSNSKASSVHRSSARISIGDIKEQVKPKSYTLLDPVNGNGLKVEYSFSSDASNVSPLLVCISASFKNCSSEPLSDIIVVHEESHKELDTTNEASAIAESAMASQGDVPTLISMEEITTLEPGQIVTRFLHVRFKHHLLPLKLALYFNGKSHMVKLRPDIGYFVKALLMDTEAFTIKESHLPGMFENTRSCTFTDHIEEQNQGKNDVSLEKDKFLKICKCLALKMLSNANFFLVSVDIPITTNLDDATGLCLRFSGELLSNSKPCLITVIVKGKCSEPLNITIKVNCEETVFGLNLLNRLVNVLSEPSPISRG